MRQLPPTLAHAADELAADAVLREAFGKVPGGEYVDYYAAVKRAEFAEYHCRGLGLGNRPVPHALSSVC